MYKREKSREKQKNNVTKTNNGLKRPSPPKDVMAIPSQSLMDGIAIMSRQMHKSNVLGQK